MFTKKQYKDKLVKYLGREPSEREIENATTDTNLNTELVLEEVKAIKDKVFNIIEPDIRALKQDVAIIKKK